MASIGFDQADDLNGVAPDAYGYDQGHTPISIGPVLRHALSVARRNLWLIVAIVATFVLVGIAFTMLQTPKYTAEASIEIANRSDEVLGDKLDPNDEQTDKWDADRYLNSQITILTSRSLAERVAQRLNLYTDPRFFSAMQADSSDYKKDADRHNAVISMIMTNFKADLPADSRVAHLSFTSTDPKMSADITNAFAQEFIQANLQRKFDSSSYARSFVQQQLQEARSRLEQSEQELNAYARQAGLIRARDANNPDGSTASTVVSGSITTSSLLQLNQAANEAQAKRVAAETRWNAERSQPLLSSPAALASPVVQQLLGKRSDLQAQLDTARDRYLETHPTVVNLESQLKNTNDQLTRAATEARNAVRADYVATQSAERALRAQVKGLEGATLEEQDRSVRYNTLAREADTNRSIYDGLLQRFRELNASAGITASNVSIVDPADRPNRPSSPNPVRNLMIALFLGIVSAAAVVFLKDQLDDRVRIPEEVEQKVGLTLLGVVPESKDEDPAEALSNPKSILSESYSALRSSLLYSTKNGLPRLMLVTSAQPSEGKSTTSYAIARSMAMIGKRTLLIDGDLRRPSLHWLAGVANKAGLSDVLVGELPMEKAIVPGDTANLSILPSGPIPPSPAELLASPRMMALLEAVREQFDFVVLDSAPVLGLADSPALSALADGVLMIIESNRGQGGQLKTAVRRLRMMKPTILGAVLTRFNPQAAGNAYSTYYQYDYYRYRSDEAGA